MYNIFHFYFFHFLGSLNQGDFRDVLQEKLRAGLGARDLVDLESGYRDPEDPRKVFYLLTSIIIFILYDFPFIITIFLIVFHL